MVGQEELSNASWRKSRRSDTGVGGGCVSIALLDSRCAIRDSKDPDGPAIIVSRAALRNLLHEIKQGKFDYDIAFITVYGQTRNTA